MSLGTILVAVAASSLPLQELEVAAGAERAVRIGMARPPAEVLLVTAAQQGGGHAEPGAPEHSARDRRLYLSFNAGAAGYLSETRTMGGVGPGIGLRYMLDPLFLIEADASYLFMIGNVLSLRGGFGVQRPGFWSPAITAQLSVLLGDRFAFIQPDHAIPLGTPTAAVGLQVALLRFNTGPAMVSALQVGAALGTEFTNFGPLLSVGLLEISVPL